MFWCIFFCIFDVQQNVYFEVYSSIFLIYILLYFLCTSKWIFWCIFFCIFDEQLNEYFDVYSSIFWHTFYAILLAHILLPEGEGRLDPWIEKKILKIGDNRSKKGLEWEKELRRGKGGGGSGEAAYHFSDRYYNTKLSASLRCFAACFMHNIGEFSVRLSNRKT